LIRNLTDPQRWKQALSLNRMAAVFVSPLYSPCKQFYKFGFASRYAHRVWLQLSYMDATATVSLHLVFITTTCPFAVQVAYDLPKDFFRLPPISSQLFFIRTCLLFSCCWKWNTLLEAFVVIINCFTLWNWRILKISSVFMVSSACTTYHTQARKATVEQSWILVPYSVSDKRSWNEPACGCGT
jgi:hypothetical protein